MWRLREKPKPKINKSLSQSYSFKDIESLSDNHRQSPPSSTKPSSIFHRVLRSTAVLRAFSSPSRPPDPVPDPKVSLKNADDRIVVYLTTLRVVRSTFEACKTVQSILTGFRVNVDERDLSMDASFTIELQRIFGVSEKTQLALPRVFIAGKYIGGAEELRQLNETGELKKIISDLPVANAAAAAGVCEECGGFKFTVCEECNGSHKCYTEKSDGFRTCNLCNHNGLIRCNACSYGPLF